ncbi:protein asteroid homolog 1 [Xiphias gladius]|uniref:protein asteroid homolog 1 n=1 Tax=Xiphias gladius TaxID=8245 RepID=UPI001A9833BE|nr:protein asteroid homolog 1 [Xiphias gladius]
MGVQGLSTLLDTYRQIYREVQLMKRRLVIDGCNLLYLMYFSSGLDQNHGGDYAAFEDQIERFVNALRDCEITPYVLLDGGSDHTDKKLETLTLRAERRIKKAHQAAVGGGKEDVLPNLAKMVFKQTLARLKVKVAQCFGEADQEIAALAREWRCPVLSNDSDFYIFDLPDGLLPIAHFKWEAVERSGSQRYIPCKSYNASSFCIVFDIQPRLLPAFAALAGNDYVKMRRTESSVDWAQFDPGRSEKSSYLEGLLWWLRDFREPREALEAAVGLLGEVSRKKKEEVLQSLTQGMEEYQVQPSSLKSFFINGTAPPFAAVEKVAGLIPDWIRLPLTQARLTGDILDVLQLQRMSLSISVDHRDVPSANLTSRPLRQVMYGLLLGGAKPLQVEERDREGLRLKIVPVLPAFRGVAQPLVLGSLNQVELSERLQVLLQALGVTEAPLSRLPSQLRLPVAVTCFWLQRAEVPQEERLVKPLLLWLSHGDRMRRSSALQADSQRCKRKLDLAVAHAFNQWQACLKDAVHLNQLLGCPLPEPQIARLYEGTLIHHLVHRMRAGGRLRAFLKSDRSALSQYRTMLSVVHQIQCRGPSTPSETRRKATQRQPLDDVTANLQQLFLQDEDEETSDSARAQEDLHLDDLVSVRTRYRTKERYNRCSDPQLARKADCRGRDIL